MKMLRYSLIFFIFFIFSCENKLLDKKFETHVYEYNAKEFIEKLKNTEGAQLVDIRTDSEYKSGHIQYAILIDYYDASFKKLLSEKLNKNYPVFIYCKSGNRSSKSIQIFKNLGFKEVNNLKGGYNELLPFVEEC